MAEMSLDLSATLLVTDLAPVPALIQRLGRLNRRAEELNASSKSHTRLCPNTQLDTIAAFVDEDEQRAG